ncbi:MAG: proline racemase family protein [Parvibaculaceae bacterium]
MRVVDSHTEGEPTRLVLDGGPPLGKGPLSERRERFQREFDDYRRFITCEPRGVPAMVGALLCEPEDRSCAAGLIFFNNTAFLGMCGHATIGAAVTLAALKRIGPGLHRFETPVGVVTAELLSPNEALIENVESYRHLKAVTVEVPGLGPVTGDVAWGGNWFFLAERSPLALEIGNIPELTAKAKAVQAALKRQGITGDDGGEIDHIEFFGPAAKGADSRSYVLCSDGNYDRSPCGTGTSAKLACLAADGKLKPGENWVQESIIGSRFTARYRPGPNGGVIPSLKGRAFITSEATLRREALDPFRNGIAA